MTHPTVQLTINEAALRKSLRHAFANHDTCVQELLQNARRAGATRIYVDYDPQTRTLKVDDDGCGIGDFNALMSVGTSGWSAEVAESEKPYGMGFLGATYACERVSIQSSGKLLTFDTEAALEGATFEVTDAPPDDDATGGTIVTLFGFDWANHDAAIKKMARGYAVPIIHGGVVLARPDACTDAFVPIDAGRCLVADCEFALGKVRVYLQGFCVFDSQSYVSDRNIVHLDSAKYFGKFPDRDKVIEQDRMVTDVKAQIEALCTERLAQLKRDLAPAEFCRTAYKLAASLGRLDVFDDVPVLPREWFGALTTMPRSWQGGGQATEACGVGEITSASVLLGQVHVATLPGFEALEIDEDGEQAAINRAWLYAYAMKSLVPTVNLNDGHWIFGMAQVTSDSQVDIDCSPALHAGQFDGSGWLGRVAIEVVETAVLDMGGSRLSITEAFYDWDREVIVVPMHNGRPAFVDEGCLCQIVDYMDDERIDDDALSEDETAINDFVRALVAETPEERTRLTLEALLRDSRALNGQRFMLEVGHDGHVKVDQLVQLPVPVSQAAAAAA